MRQFLARLAISFAALLVALVAAFVAVGFFAFALYQFILPYMNPALAALATGIVILIAAMLLMFATKLAAKTAPRKRKLMDDPGLGAAEGAAELGNVLGQHLRGLAEAHGNGSLWASLAAGFAIGVSPKLRSLLRDLLKI